MGIRRFACLCGIAFIASVSGVHALEPSCTLADEACAWRVLETEAAKIENTAWRDQVYRETAKLLAAEGRTDEALAFIPKIQMPDTQAMTIRGIGMAAAELTGEPGWDKVRFDALFARLRTQAETITHPPSYAIALTYIAMAQAFAGDDEGAWKTASEMDNDALRHKAYGETAEIQAERHDVDAAMKSIGFIDSEAYRNKAYSTVSGILADRGLYDAAFEAAMPITNAYKKAAAIQSLLDKRRQDKVKVKPEKRSTTN